MASTEKSRADVEYRSHKRDTEAGVPAKKLDIDEHEQPLPDSIHQVRSHASHADNAISLSEVDPVSVRLDHLCVSVDEAPNAFAKLFSKKKVTTGQGHVKNILDDVSADLPSGTLTAIIGGSGS